MIREGLRRRLEGWLLQVWFQQPRGVSRLVALALAPIAIPLSLLVARIARRRRARIVRQTAIDPVPVIVVGNLVAGGAGKTPIAIALAIGLEKLGCNPGLLAGGYRASNENARIVHPGSRAEEVGDEALLLARETGMPVAVGRQRAEALARLLATHPQVDVVISDDGLQHEALARRVEIVVIDERGVGNDWCLPAGPLREPADRLETVDFVVLGGAGGTGGAGDTVGMDPILSEACLKQQAREQAPACEALVAEPRGACVLGHRVRDLSRSATTLVGVRSLDGSQSWTIEAFAAFAATTRTAAIAGIARPSRFFDALHAAGISPARCVALGDHAEIDIAMLEALDAGWVLMTEKDAVKLDHAPPTLRARCLAVSHRAQLDEGLLRSIAAMIGAATTESPALRTRLPASDGNPA